ncbi:MAG: hypothetical protein AAGA99_15160 [Actinomycetota bacterium]
MTVGVVPATWERLSDLDGERSSWWFAAWDTEAVGCWIQVTAHRPSGRTWYVATWVEAGGSPVIVADDEMPWPRPERYLEIRGRGLWAHHVCEEPLQRWSVGLEAVAVAHDDPAQGLDDGWGDPDGLAGDLEWEGIGPVTTRGAGYDQPCRVDGVYERVGRELRLDDASGHRGRFTGDDEPSLVLVGRLEGRPVAAVGEARWSPVELPRHASADVDGATVSAAPTAHVAWRWPDGATYAVASVELTSADGRTGSGLVRWRGVA